MDTIVFRLHDVKKHFSLVNQIIASTTGYTINLESVDVTTPLKSLFQNLIEQIEQGVVLQKGDIIEIMDHKHDGINSVSEFLKMKTVIFGDTNRKLNAAYRGKNKMRSSNYDLTTSICYDRNFIEWNFSIPKFLYGTNLFQFVPHPGEHNYNHTVINWSMYKRDLFDRFMTFAKNFFSKNFMLGGEHKLDLMELEINRIDFCWNQFFRSKNEALVRLGYIEKMKLRGVRSGSERFTEYNESTMWITDGYSKKVYHKGAEFRKNDMKELTKKGHFSKNEIENMADMADRCLRFEVTLRKKHLSYLYQTTLWRSKSAGQNEFRERAKDGRKFYNLKKENLPEYEKQCKQLGKSDIDGRINAYIINEACKNYRRCFVLGNSDSVNYFNENFSPIELDPKNKEIRLTKEVCMNKQIFNLWHDFLENFILETEVKFLPSYDALEEKIRKHNESRSIYRETFDVKYLESIDKATRMAATRIFRSLNILEKNTIEEIEKFQLLSRTTIWRLKKDLKTLKMDLNVNMHGDSERVALASDFISAAYDDEGRMIREETGFLNYSSFIIDMKKVQNKTYC